MTITDDDDGWDVVPADWWKISYAAVDWNWKKPLLFGFSRVPDQSVEGSSSDIELSSQLIGVRATEQVLALYESLVGFYADSPLSISRGDPAVPELKQHQLSSRKDRWDKLMVDLMTVMLPPPPALTLKIHKDEQGFYSIQEIPLLRGVAGSHGRIRKPKTKVTQASKTRSLVDQLRLGRDISPVRVERETVSTSPSPTPLYAFADSYPSRISVSEDGDRDIPDSVDTEGWIKPDTENAKSRRARALFKVLRRHRSKSTSVSTCESSVDHDADELQLSLPPLSPSTSTSPSPSSSTHSSPSSSSLFSNDGWIEGVQSPPPKVTLRKPPPLPPQKGKKKSQSLGSITFPVHAPAPVSFLPQHHHPQQHSQYTALPPPPTAYPSFTMNPYNPFISQPYVPQAPAYFYNPYMPIGYVGFPPVPYHYPTMHHHRHASSMSSRPPVR